MATVKSTHESRVLQIVQRAARRAFAGRWDFEERVADALSVAWEGLQAKPDAPPGGVAYYAIRRVRSGRQFRQSKRSIDGPTDLRYQPAKPGRMRVARVVPPRDTCREFAEHLAQNKKGPAS